jgi:hypothetical protein
MLKSPAVSRKAKPLFQSVPARCVATTNWSSPVSPGSSAGQAAPKAKEADPEWVGVNAAREAPVTLVVPRARTVAVADRLVSDK